MVPSVASTLLAGATLGAGHGFLSSFSGAGSALNTAAGLAIGAGSVVSGGFKGGVQGMRSATQSAAEAYSLNSPLEKTAASPMTRVAGGALLGAGKAALYEIARDLGSPNFRGHRTQRLFENIADKLAPNDNVGTMEPPLTPKASEDKSAL